MSIIYDRDSPGGVLNMQPPCSRLHVVSQNPVHEAVEQRGDSTQPCLTPVVTLQSTDAPSAVLPQHHVQVPNLCTSRTKQPVLKFTSLLHRARVLLS